MRTEGTLLKMRTQLKDVVEYQLPVGDVLIPLNELLGREIQINFLNQIYCVKCGKKTYKSFNQGFCYPCFTTAPEADPAIIRPELDMAHKGISRDMEWAKKYSLQPHYVYLAVSSGLKVGVTRSIQVITRWIDQGAWKGIKLAETPYRHLAGLIEVELKNHFADKTNWRRMLMNIVDQNINLVDEKNKAGDLIPDDLQQYVIEDNEIIEIKYPVNQYPEKVNSINFDKIGEYRGTLCGIKGQYLIFEDQHVMNIRKHNGYLVSIEI